MPNAAADRTSIPRFSRCMPVCASKAALLLAAGLLLLQPGCLPLGAAQWPARSSPSRSATDNTEVGTTCQLSLADRDGQRLPPRIEALLWPQLTVHSTDDSRQLPAKSSMILTPGRWRVCMRGHLPHSFARLLEFEVQPTRNEVLIPLASNHRLVQLSIAEAADRGYCLWVTHESGVEVEQSGNPSGMHLLLLPPGPCTISVQPAQRAIRSNRSEHRFVVGEDFIQEWQWPPGGRP
jgi:hypothetical protein